MCLDDRDDRARIYLVDMCVESWFSIDLMLHPEHIVLRDISFV